MLKKVFRLIARLAVLGSLMYLARTALKRWIDGPEPGPAETGSRWTPIPDSPRVAPPANLAPLPAASTEPVAARPAPRQPRPDRGPRADRPLRANRPLKAERPLKAQGRAVPGDGSAAAPKSSAGRRAEAGAQGGPGGVWVAPDESGTAPSTHPVKAKLSSRTYREPGSSGYDRSRPDRCYVSAEAAEADGFSRAKR